MGKRKREKGRKGGGWGGGEERVVSEDQRGRDGEEERK